MAAAPFCIPTVYRVPIPHILADFYCLLCDIVLFISSIIITYHPWSEHKPHRTEPPSMFFTPSPQHLWQCLEQEAFSHHCVEWRANKVVGQSASCIRIWARKKSSYFLLTLSTFSVFILLERKFVPESWPGVTQDLPRRQSQVEETMMPSPALSFLVLIRRPVFQ